MLKTLLFATVIALNFFHLCMKLLKSDSLIYYRSTVKYFDPITRQTFLRDTPFSYDNTPEVHLLSIKLGKKLCARI